MKTEHNLTAIQPFKAKFYGCVYDVIPTKVITKKVNHHFDGNGYEVESYLVKSQQYGMSLNGEQKYTVKKFNDKYHVFENGGKSIGVIAPLFIPEH